MVQLAFLGYVMDELSFRSSSDRKHSEMDTRDFRSMCRDSSSTDDCCSISVSNSLMRASLSSVAFWSAPCLSWWKLLTYCRNCCFCSRRMRTWRMDLMRMGHTGGLFCFLITTSAMVSLTSSTLCRVLNSVNCASLSNAVCEYVKLNVEYGDSGSSNKSKLAKSNCSCVFLGTPKTNL